MKVITGSQTRVWTFSTMKVCTVSSVEGETAAQLCPSGVSTSRDAAMVRVTSSTAMMTATASASVAISLNRKRNMTILWPGAFGCGFDLTHMAAASVLQRPWRQEMTLRRGNGRLPSAIDEPYAKNAAGDRA